MSASSRWITNSISLSLSFLTSSRSSRSRESSQASWGQRWQMLPRSLLEPEGGPFGEGQILLLPPSSCSVPPRPASPSPAGPSAPSLLPVERQENTHSAPAAAAPHTGWEQHPWHCLGGGTRLSSASACHHSHTLGTRLLAPKNSNPGPRDEGKTRPDAASPAPPSPLRTPPSAPW